MAANIPAPGRIPSGSVEDQLQVIRQWNWDFYQGLILETDITTAVEDLQTVQAQLSQAVIALQALMTAIGEVAQLTQSISASPTQAQVENIQAKVNEIIQAASST